MMWLLRRTAAIWLILGTMCAGVVGIVRANGVQDRLQALGFSVCDGEPCFRGIKVGSSWSETDFLISGATVVGPPMVFLLDTIDGKVAVVVYPSDDGKTVWGINLESSFPSSRPSAADLVQRFGYPCGVRVVADSVGIRWMVMIYPQFTSSVFKQDLRLSLDSQVWSLEIREPDPLTLCPSPPDQFNGPWRGFTSGEVYVARNRRALGITPTP